MNSHNYNIQDFKKYIENGHGSDHKSLTFNLVEFLWINNSTSGDQIITTHKHVMHKAWAAADNLVMQPLTTVTSI